MSVNSEQSAPQLEELPKARASHAEPALPVAVNPDTAEAPAPEPPNERYEALAVPGFLDALVSLPAAVGPQPVWVATHGAGGAPEHHCQMWRAHLGQRGIILCLRGAMMDRRYGAAAGFYYPDHHALERELVATLASFEGAYADHIEGKGYVFAGYSQGATMGALLLPKYAATFPRAILIEGGFGEWSLAAANTFRKHGGERIAFVCGVRGCSHGARNSASLLTRAEVAVQHSYAAGAGHTYLGAVARETASLLPWLLAGDARWDR